MPCLNTPIGAKVKLLKPAEVRAALCEAGLSPIGDKVELQKRLAVHFKAKGGGGGAAGDEDSKAGGLLGTPGAPGYSWGVLGAPGDYFGLLGAPGDYLGLLCTTGDYCGLLGTPGGHLGDTWVPLGFLVAPGGSW